MKFDEANLVSCAGLAPVMVLADSCGLAELVKTTVTVPGSAGANAYLKVSALVAGMGRGRGLHRRHGPAAARRDELVVRRDPGAEHAGKVPPARRGRRDGAGRVGRAQPAAGWRGGCDLRRRRRHGQADLRLRQAGRRVRLLGGQGAQRAAGHGEHPEQRPGDRGDPGCGRDRRTRRGGRPGWSPTRCAPPGGPGPVDGSSSAPTPPTTTIRWWPLPDGPAPTSPSPRG